MSLAIALTVLTATAIPPADRARGWLELGGGAYSATHTVSTKAEGARGGVSGPVFRWYTGFGFPIAPGLIVGPAVGMNIGFTSAAPSLCCGDATRVYTTRLGIEAAYYPQRNIGFRVSGGFGYASSHLSVQNDEQGVLRTAAPSGIYFTAAIARDYSVARNTRVGGVLRIDADALTGDDGFRAYSLRSFTPSLSLVVVTQWPN